MATDRIPNRSDDEADRADEARAEWIAERAAALEVLYANDAEKVGAAVADFFLSDEGLLAPNLTNFLLRFDSAPTSSSHLLRTQLRSEIAPILREYAEDAAAAEWDQMETAASAEAERAAA